MQELQFCQRKSLRVEHILMKDMGLEDEKIDCDAEAAAREGGDEAAGGEGRRRGISP